MEKFPDKKVEEKESKLNGCFVGGITEFITESDIYNHFKKCGEVVKVDYPKMKNNRLKRGYCHVYFKNERDCNLAIKTQTHILKGVKLKVRKALDPKIAKKISKESQQRKVFVGNLHPKIKEKTIKYLMESFGPVEAVVMQHSFFKGVKKFKGYAFVLMKNEKSAKKALLGQNIEYKGRTIQIKPALPKGLTENQARSKGIMKKYFEPFLKNKTLINQLYPNINQNEQQKIIEKNFFEQTNELNQKYYQNNLELQKLFKYQINFSNISLDFKRKKNIYVRENDPSNIECLHLKGNNIDVILYQCKLCDLELREKLSLDLNMLGKSKSHILVRLKKYRK